MPPQIAAIIVPNEAVWFEVPIVAELATDNDDDDEDAAAAATAAEDDNEDVFVFINCSLSESIRW